MIIILCVWVDAWLDEHSSNISKFRLSFCLDIIRHVQRTNNLMPHSIWHLYLRDDMAEYLNYECSGMAGSLEGVDRRLWPHLETITLRLRFNSESHCSKGSWNPWLPVLVSIATLARSFLLSKTTRGKGSRWMWWRYSQGLDNKTKYLQGKDFLSIYIGPGLLT